MAITAAAQVPFAETIATTLPQERKVLFQDCSLVCPERRAPGHAMDLPSMDPDQTKQSNEEILSTNVFTI
jgi:hypothetical protein